MRPDTILSAAHGARTMGLILCFWGLVEHKYYFAVLMFVLTHIVSSMFLLAAVLQRIADARSLEEQVRVWRKRGREAMQ